MPEREVRLILKPEYKDTVLRFRHTQVVADVLSELNRTSERYLIIEDDNGALIGIVEIAKLLQRTTSSNLIERQRWSNMPLGFAIEARLDAEPNFVQRTRTGFDTRVEAEIPGICIATHNDDLAALIFEKDLYLKWDSVKKILSNALIDNVTGLPNRLAFERRLADEWHRLERNSEPLCVLLIDIDHFKQINDEFGHSVGDLVLREIGRVLQHQLRSYDLLARYGGDEFAAILRGCSADRIEIPIVRIQQGINRLSLPDVENLQPITLSIGAAIIQSQFDCEETEQLVNQADECLYRAKENGRDCAFVLDLGIPSADPKLIGLQSDRIREFDAAI